MMVFLRVEIIVIRSGRAKLCPIFVFETRLKNGARLSKNTAFSFSISRPVKKIDGFCVIYCFKFFLLPRTFYRPACIYCTNPSISHDLHVNLSLSAYLQYSE